MRLSRSFHKRLAPGFCPQIEAGVGDRCKSEVHDSLVRAEPAQMGIVGQLAELRAEAGHQLLKVGADQLLREHLDRTADEVVTGAHR